MNAIDGLSNRALPTPILLALVLGATACGANSVSTTARTGTGPASSQETTTAPRTPKTAAPGASVPPPASGADAATLAGTWSKSFVPVCTLDSGASGETGTTNAPYWNQGACASSRPAGPMQYVSTLTFTGSSISVQYMIAGTDCHGTITVGPADPAGAHTMHVDHIQCNGSAANPVDVTFTVKGDILSFGKDQFRRGTGTN